MHIYNMDHINEKEYIVTSYYEMTKTSKIPCNLTIQWKHKKKPQIIYSNSQIEIFKVSESEIAFVVDDQLLYANYEDTEPEYIIGDIYGSVYYSELYRKFIVYNDQSDPPDILLIIPVDDIINEPIDEIFKDERTAYDNGKFYVTSLSDWSNDIHVGDKYIYIVGESSSHVHRIDIDTKAITMRQFDDTCEISDAINAHMGAHGYVFGRETKDGVIINCIDSDEPDDSTILGTIEVKFM